MDSETTPMSFSTFSTGELNPLPNLTDGLYITGLPLLPGKTEASTMILSESTRPTTPCLAMGLGCSGDRSPKGKPSTRGESRLHRGSPGLASKLQRPMRSDSRHLHAGHRLGSLQGNPQTSPDGLTLRWFRCHVLVHDESRVVHLAFVFLIHTGRVMLDVSPTLTTATLNDSRFGWFEAGS